ncbi:PLP-dependent aminotransferase family protein [Actinospica sp.]|uniref:MocR-like pyridoxine biosynthesis transcription factor PdxR n=1 Tax=Actinospica sp. TaxID=1872142 RepID=UPI002BB5F8B1|nr:PLP-dependent aminotransferase family protein [Actinospica sp.]HWG24227.1 PLP-dependent aminotransferase family protein [Actinospica sp.]
MSSQSNTTAGEFPADLLVELDRSRPRGLRAQLERGLRQAVARGSLAPGTVLPPSRVLAAELLVSRSLVVGAYEQLVIEGYLEARQGSGTQVRALPGIGGTPGAAASGNALYWPVPVGRDGAIAGSGLPDLALFPRDEWLRHYRDVLRELPDSALTYPPPRGVHELRAALTAYLGRVRGVRTGPDQIVICGGFSQGLVLVCRALQRRGVTRIAVEDPCFVFHRTLIAAAGLEAVPVPVDGQGIQASRLAALDVGAVLLSPAHSYPSGVVLSADRRVELLNWARAADAFVIEDDYDAELRYDHLPIGALQGLDPERVVYGGTVSKVLSPALRLGWLVVPRQFIEDVISAKFLEDFASEALGQLTLARFIDSGALARHLRRVRPVYRSRRDRLLAELDAHLPQLQPSGEAAGLHLLLRLPAGLDPDTVAETAANHGIHLEAAKWHWADHDKAPPALLIGYGALRESTLAHGIEALGKDLNDA